MRPLAAALPNVTRAALGKRGFALAALLAEWQAIVGPTLAASTAPLRLAKGRNDEGAVLELRVESTAAVELQHNEPRIIERINAHFGYNAVQRLKLRHGAVAAPSRAVPPIRRIGTAEERTLFGQLEGVEDDSLRDALAGLGRVVIGSRRP
ncbi:MAG: DUF721 domain-containing protein [Alphaproteobacteria bacterium]|nr:DUF721 domain-containing protein [Alphaproteobacteria bacterium]